jgi:hypothetical protein
MTAPKTWEAKSLSKERQRRVDSLFAWAEYHRRMSSTARANGEGLARGHDDEVEKIEAEITRTMTGRLEGA